MIFLGFFVILLAFYLKTEVNVMPMVDDYRSFGRL
jgi:hypothetical protein